MGILFVDESGNPFCPRGPEVLSVSGIFAEGRGVSQLRGHAEQARRRAALPVSELRYRLKDSRSKRYFFDEERLLRLPLRVWAVTVRIADMAAFRQKYDPRMLYEHLLYVLVSDVVCGLGRVPATIHFDPCSSFYSQRAFARRLQADFAGCRVAFAHRIPSGRRACRSRTWQREPFAGTIREWTRTTGKPSSEGVVRLAA